ncbi:MAG: hypothetical protein ACR5KV_06475 [Wolbachia sp.]
MRSYLSAIDGEEQVLKLAIELMFDQSVYFGHENIDHFMSVFYYSKEYKNLVEKNVTFSFTILSILNNLYKYREVLEFSSEVINLPTITIEDIMMVRYEVAVRR